MVVNAVSILASGVGGQCGNGDGNGDGNGNGNGEIRPLGRARKKRKEGGGFQGKEGMSWLELSTGWRAPRREVRIPFPHGFDSLDTWR
jgi:hypothetical protein